jgi:SSS family solute:Na+ symporter
MLFGRDILVASMPWPVVDPILVALPLAILATVIVSLITKGPSDKHLAECFRGVK